MNHEQPMSRPLIAGLTATATFVVLFFVLLSVETAFDNSLAARNRIGVLIVALAGAAAACAGYALAMRDRDAGERDAAAAAIVPVCVLSVVFAVLSDADALTNVAVAIVGPLGALAGVWIVGRRLR